MIFAQIPQEAILNLKGLRFHLFAIVQLEMFESGAGVCKLTPRELSEKYPVLGNYDSLCRYRKAMIGEGWLIEAVGGLITKGTDKKSVPEKPTDEISVPPSNVLIFNQQTPTEFNNTDEISVNEENELINYQSGTDEISGTPIANKDLELKDNLIQESLSLVRERETPDFDEASEIVGGVSPTEQTSEQSYHEIVADYLKIQMNTKVSLPDEREWLQAIEWARENEFPSDQAIETYELLAQIKARKRGKWTITPAFWKRSIPKVESLRMELDEIKTGASEQNGSDQKQNQSGSRHRQTSDEQRNSSAANRIKFDRLAGDILESQGIIQTRRS